MRKLHFKYFEAYFLIHSVLTVNININKAELEWIANNYKNKNNLFKLSWNQRLDSPVYASS